MVSQNLVPPESYLAATNEYVLADSTSRMTCRSAMIEIDSPFLKGRVRASVATNLTYPLIIGNSALMEDGTRRSVPVYATKEKNSGNGTTQAKSRQTQPPLLPEVEINRLSVNPEQLRVLQQSDVTLKKIREYVGQPIKTKGKRGVIRFEEQQGILLRVYTENNTTFSQVCVPLSLRGEVLRLAHDNPMGGHFGARKTRDRVRRSYYWPGIAVEVRGYVRSCNRCQRTQRRVKWKMEEKGRKKNGQAGSPGRFRLQYKNGNLFRCEKTEALAHCVSRDMVMGKGIALTFKEMFGGVKELKSQRKNVGDVAILPADESYIYYLVTKERYNQKPTYETLQSSLEAMKKDLVEKGIRGLSMPMIGCGHDRLVWEKVEKMLYKTFSDTNLTITIYEYK